MQITNEQAIARQCRAVRFDLQVEAAVQPLGEGACGARDLSYRGLDLPRQPVNSAKVRAIDLDADGRANPGRQHVGARLDRHRPGVADARHPHGGVHLGHQRINGEARAPRLRRLEGDDRLEHLGGRRVGRGGGPSGLAKHHRHFGKAADDAVLGLQQFRRLGHRQARQGDRHEHQRAFVQRRHELAADPCRWPGRRGKQCQGDKDHHGLGAQHAGDDRPVEPDQRAVQWVAVLGYNSSADEGEHQHRNQRDRQQRTGRHGECLGERQRLEHPAFLVLQGKHRQERNRDDRQAEEQCGTHLGGGVEQHAGARGIRWCPLKMLVGVLDHHD